MKENDSEVALRIVFQQIHACMYHLSTVDLFLTTSAAFTHHESQFSNPDPDFVDHMNSDRVVCFAHLRAFFWELRSLVDSLRSYCIRQAEKEGTTIAPETKEKMEKFLKSQAWTDINAIRNFSHSTASPLGARLRDGKLAHFLETSDGREIPIPEHLVVYLDAVRQFLQTVLVIPPELLTRPIHVNRAAPSVSLAKPQAAAKNQ
ncbi:MAG: hypothetical protein DMG81_01650 [Acidobacteria bacterium]|nr:MAG: hypothetical protein DMG81_01650 [Acidobacteriota bacterium]